MGDKATTRVFKKTSPNGKISVYLGKRDFVDHLDQVDPVDGVVLVDPEYLQDRKVFVSLACVFRYGREDVDVLGLSFRKDLHVSTLQAFPPVLEPKPLSSLQEKLLRKLGANAHPFRFGIPENLPCSVTLQPGPEDTSKACGVDYELKAYCARAAGEKLHPRNSVQLVIRKVQYAPEKKGPQPVAECSRGFLLSERPLQLEASLDKELYYHGEPINVNVHVSNNSSKTVRKVKIAVRQYADICLFSKAQYKCPVAELEAEMKENCNKEALGIVVSYRVKVKLVVSRGSDISLELPFVLMHPKPSDPQPAASPDDAAAAAAASADLVAFDSEVSCQTDELVFHDFTRLGLTGDEGDVDPLF